jgi:hypothetical protein
MLAFSIGLAWLLLAPLSLWVLVRGRNGARAGAVLTLLLLEGSTIAMGSAAKVYRGPAVVAHDMPTAAAAAALGACEPRLPTPETARLSGAHDDLVLSWRARPDECSTAKVLLQPTGRELRVWVHEGPLTAARKGVRTLPVHVTRGAASLTVPLHLSPHTRYRTVDGRTGRRIPKPH